MKLASLLALPFLFVASVAVLAQDPTPAKEPPPEPPLLNNAPAECQWTITFTSKTPEKDPDSPENVRNRNMRLRYSPRTLSKHVLKSAGQVVTFTEYEAGLKSEGWIVNGYFCELPFHEGDSIRINSQGGGDFPDVYWITADNFRGTVEYKGAKVHLYEIDTTNTRQDPSQVANPSAKPTAPPVKVTPRRAYIDAKSRLPVAVDMGTTVLTYQYSGPSATFPTPDERIRKLMSKPGPPKKS